MLKKFMTYKNTDLGLLVLRVALGLIMANHGYGKLMAHETMLHEFGDPIGLGSELSYILVVFAEFFCSILLVLGLATRAALIPLIITTAVIVFVAHGADPWGKKEMGALFGVTYLALLFTGPGKLSADNYLFGKQ